MLQSCTKLKCSEVAQFLGILTCFELQFNSYYLCLFPNIPFTRLTKPGNSGGFVLLST